MSCDHCVGHVRQAVSAVPGVTAVEVDLASGTAVVQAGPEASEERIRAAVEEEGYEVQAIRRG
jgi:copper chaperone CopZ